MGSSMKAIVAVLMCGIAFPIGAQAPVRDTSWREPSARLTHCSPELELYRGQIRSLSQHTGWGMFLGGVAGTVYGIAQARGPMRGLVIIWDGFIGSTSGMVVGSAAYAARRFGGYSPLPSAGCGVPPNEALKLSAQVEAAGSLRSPAAFYYKRRSLTPAR